MLPALTDNDGNHNDLPSGIRELYDADRKIHDVVADMSNVTQSGDELRHKSSRALEPSFAADAILLCCYPEGRSYDVRAYMHKIVKEIFFDPSFSYVVVQDSNTREMLAVACWYFRTVDKSVGSLRACISTAPKESYVQSVQAN